MPKLCNFWVMYRFNFFSSAHPNHIYTINDQIIYQHHILRGRAPSSQTRLYSLSRHNLFLRKEVVVNTELFAVANKLQLRFLNKYISLKSHLMYTNNNSVICSQV